MQRRWGNQQQNKQKIKDDEEEEQIQKKVKVEYSKIINQKSSVEKKQESEQLKEQNQQLHFVEGNFRITQTKQLVFDEQNESSLSLSNFSPKIKIYISLSVEKIKLADSEYGKDEDSNLTLFLFDVFSDINYKNVKIIYIRAQQLEKKIIVFSSQIEQNLLAICPELHISPNIMKTFNFCKIKGLMSTAFSHTHYNYDINTKQTLKGKFVHQFFINVIVMGNKQQNFDFINNVLSGYAKEDCKNALVQNQVFLELIDAFFRKFPRQLLQINVSKENFIPLVASECLASLIWIKKFIIQKSFEYLPNNSKIQFKKYKPTKTTHSLVSISKFGFSGILDIIFEINQWKENNLQTFYMPIVIRTGKKYQEYIEPLIQLTNEQYKQQGELGLIVYLSENFQNEFLHYSPSRIQYIMLYRNSLVDQTEELQRRLNLNTSTEFLESILKQQNNNEGLFDNDTKAYFDQMVKKVKGENIYENNYIFQALFQLVFNQHLQNKKNSIIKVQQEIKLQELEPQMEDLLKQMQFSSLDHYFCKLVLQTRDYAQTQMSDSTIHNLIKLFCKINKSLVICFTHENYVQQFNQNLNEESQMKTYKVLKDEQKNPDFERLFLKRKEKLIVLTEIVAFLTLKIDFFFEFDYCIIQNATNISEHWLLPCILTSRVFLLNDQVNCLSQRINISKIAFELEQEKVKNKN